MEQIGKYEVSKKLGEGATSEVYLCHDPFGNRDVAVKVVLEDRLDRTPATRQAAQASSSSPRPRSPASCSTRTSCRSTTRWSTPKMSYIVMEYVPGGTLEQFCDPDKLLPVDKIVEIIFKCTRALDFANKLGVTHRDIKPANILLPGETDIKISDFGAALMASSDQTQVSGIGSPAYMSPQQIKEHAAQPPDRHLFARRGDVPAAHRRRCLSRRATTSR